MNTNQEPTKTKSEISDYKILGKVVLLSLVMIIVTDFYATLFLNAMIGISMAQLQTVALYLFVSLLVVIGSLSLLTQTWLKPIFSFFGKQKPSLDEIDDETAKSAWSAAANYPARLAVWVFFFPILLIFIFVAIFLSFQYRLPLSSTGLILFSGVVAASTNCMVAYIVGRRWVNPLMTMIARIKPMKREGLMISIGWKFLLLAVGSVLITTLTIVAIDYQKEQKLMLESARSSALEQARLASKTIERLSESGYSQKEIITFIEAQEIGRYGFFGLATAANHPLTEDLRDVKLPLTGDQDEMVGNDKEGKLVFASVKVPSLDWKVVAVVDRRNIIAPMAKARSNWSLWSIALLYLVLAVFLSSAISQDVTRSTNWLMRLLDSMSKGELGHRLSPISDDELGNLVESLNVLEQHLQETTDKVKSLSQGDLTQNIDLRSESDLLGKALRETFANLNLIMTQVSRASTILATSAEEISANAVNISSGMESQATATEQTSASIEEMAVSIAHVADNVENLISRIQEVSASIEEMAASIEQVANNSETMTESVLETSSSIEQMAASIGEVAQNVSETNKAAEQAVVEVQESGSSVEKTIGVMTDIAETIDHSTKVIQELGKRSEEIGVITEVISDIAEQTNLLALNAAIEAARAGEHGRGFAVVADEVRKLAERSTKSTEEIANLIESIQAETAGAVDLTEDGSKKVQEGVSIANQAGESLQKVVETITQVTQLMNEIAIATQLQTQGSEQILKAVEKMNELTTQVNTAAREQAAGTKQIIDSTEKMNVMTQEVGNLIQEQKQGGEEAVKAVENINQVTQQSLNATQEMAKAAEDLTNQSENLKELVQSFNVREETSD